MAVSALSFIILSVYRRVLHQLVDYVHQSISFTADWQLWMWLQQAAMKTVFSVGVSNWHWQCRATRVRHHNPISYWGHSLLPSFISQYSTVNCTDETNTGWFQKNHGKAKYEFQLYQKEKFPIWQFTWTECESSPLQLDAIGEKAMLSD